MRFISRHDEPIASLSDWQRLGKPASESHWREGRSAYELASEWVDGDAEAQVTELLSLRPELDQVALVEGIAEKQTHFDDAGRGPRNHDLLIHATTASGPLVIGVEGKADEAFDLPLWRWRQERLADTPTSEAPKRLDGLTKHFFGTTIDKDRDHPSLGCLGYQLLSALAGTLADAKEAASSNAVLLVHEFVTSETEEEKHAANARGLEDFITRLSPTRDRAGTEDAWITEAVIVEGDGEWMPASTNVWIAKLITRRR